MSAVAMISPPISDCRQGINLWSTEHGSPANVAHDLTNTYCAPREITAFPNVLQMDVRPAGASKPMTFRVDKEWATLLNNHLQAMRANGQRPSFNYDHKPELGVAGYPSEYFWQENYGVVAFVTWTPRAEQMILDGTYTGFSPTWIHCHGSFPLGLTPDCGALLHRTVKPALRLMPPISPIRKRVAVSKQAARFVERLSSRAGRKLPSSPGDTTTLEAFNSTARDYPELHEAYELKKALEAAFVKDLEVYG